MQRHRRSEQACLLAGQFSSADCPGCQPSAVSRLLVSRSSPCRALFLLGRRPSIPVPTTCALATAQQAQLPAGWLLQRLFPHQHFRRSGLPHRGGFRSLSLLAGADEVPFVSRRRSIGGGLFALLAGRLRAKQPTNFTCPMTKLWCEMGRKDGWGCTVTSRSSFLSRCLVRM